MAPTIYAIVLSEEERAQLEIQIHPGGTDCALLTAGTSRRFLRNRWVPRTL